MKEKTDFSACKKIKLNLWEKILQKNKKNDEIWSLISNSGLFRLLFVSFSKLQVSEGKCKWNGWNWWVVSGDIRNTFVFNYYSKAE